MTKSIVIMGTLSLLVCAGFFMTSWGVESAQADSATAEFDALFGDMLVGTTVNLQADIFCDAWTITKVDASTYIGESCGCSTYTFLGTLSGTGGQKALHLHPNEAEFGFPAQVIIGADRSLKFCVSSGVVNTDTWSGGCPGGSPNGISGFDS